VFPRTTAGIKTASYYWIGSEGAWPGGRAPSEWKRFSSRTSERKKVDRILEWLGRPPGEQPRLITSWFHGADHAGHHDGPGTPDDGSGTADGPPPVSDGPLPTIDTSDPPSFAGMTIPDPGSGAANWEDTEYEQHETPAKAYKVGVVTQNNPYVTMDMHPSGRAYLVFRSGPNLTRIDIDMGGSTNTVQSLYLHMHDGENLKFGAAIQPISISTSKGAWPLKPNHVSVFEIGLPIGIRARGSSAWHLQTVLLTVASVGPYS